MVGRLNLDWGTLNLDGGMLNLDGGTLVLDWRTRPPRPPYNLSAALHHYQSYLNCGLTKLD